MFPGCMRGTKSSEGSNEEINKQTKSIVQIYTDWANHYLEKGRSKRRVTQLACDCNDGILLADVIESVTGTKIPNINRKPKTTGQMLDNIHQCLLVLKSQNIAGIETVAAQDLRDGRLKAVLALFFALSRHKQTTKQRLVQPGYNFCTSSTNVNKMVYNEHHGLAPQNTDTPIHTSTLQRQLGSKGLNHIPSLQTSIPVPGTTIPTRRCPPDKPKLTNDNHTPAPSSGSPSVTSSRASSPAVSLIPRAGVNGAPNRDSHNLEQAHHINSYQQNKNMLDKLKLFKQQERNISSGSISNGKRTSSSSGISSSTKSEKSDSGSITEEKITRPIPNAATRLAAKTAMKPSLKKSNLPGNVTPITTKTLAKKEPPPKTKIASSKLIEPKLKPKCDPKMSSVTNIPSQIPALTNTGIPKPTAAIKGTAKISAIKEASMERVGNKFGGINRSSDNLKQNTAIVSPLKNESISTSSSLTGSSLSVSHKSDISVVSKAKDDEKSAKIKVETDEKYDEKYDDKSIESNVKPMMPLDNIKNYNLNGHGPGSNHPRLLVNINEISQEYGHLDGLDMNGYMSEGEVLRRASYDSNAVSNRTNRDCDSMLLDGYVSEDGRALQKYYPSGMGAPVGSVAGIRRLQPSFLGSSRNLIVLSEQTRSQRQATTASPRHHDRGADAEEPPQQPPPLGPRPATAAPGRSRGHRSNSTNEISAATLAAAQNNAAQWKKYTDSPGVGSPIQTPGSPTSVRKRSSPHHGSNQGAADVGKSLVKGRVPTQSFGFVKRNSLGSTSVNNLNAETTSTVNKTAQVTAVPRTKVKVSGGTQTCSSDLQQHKSTGQQYKSFSLTGNSATQLSQSIRERLLMGSQSLPKGALNNSSIQQEYNLIMRQNRIAKISDGSLSDTQASEAINSYGPWIRHSNTYSIGPRMAETDSMDSLASAVSHRGSLSYTRFRDTTSARLSRSNSIRSTKSEKLYPSMMHRGSEIEAEPYYCLPVGTMVGGYPMMQHWSQPATPAPNNVTMSPRMMPLSPTHIVTSARHSVKNDEVHGSSISLVSNSSSLYSSAEEKQAHEIRKLRRELMDAQEKVQTLTSQLTTNAHVVSAFEQSLSSMTQRLQHLTATSEKKDHELAELKAVMESLRTQSVQRGLSSGLARQPSSDSVSSISSACSVDKHEKKKKKGWLRSSFTKAFSRNTKPSKAPSLDSHSNGSGYSNATGTIAEVCSNVSNMSIADGVESKVSDQSVETEPSEVEELQKQLREKDMVLTDIRLEALSSAHQLESLKDTVMKMRNEMLSLKQNNERLQRMVGGSIPIDNGENDSITEPPPDVIAVEEPLLDNETEGKRIAISIYLGQPHTFERYFNENYSYDEPNQKTQSVTPLPENLEIVIAQKNIGCSMSWGQLDALVRRNFKQHVCRLDPENSLGLGGDSIIKYRLGEAERSPEAQLPDLLPVGYVVGRVSTLHIILQPVCAFAFETLIPRGVAQRLVSLLSEHRRLVLCGPPGTGKTFLAQKLAEFHAHSQGRDPGEAVATFNVDPKSGKELRQYLGHISEQCTSGNDTNMPCVVILDNLHKAGPLGDTLGALPRTLPCLIGTMAQAACNTTSLQLQHGFRWVLIAPHMEPCSGLLGRVLRRRLSAFEITQEKERPELAAIVGWLPRVWRHLNKFLEIHSSTDVAIGPRLFLGCPLDLDASKVWFADIWNYSLAPYLREAAKEGLQLYGKRAAWIDPLQFILDTYPWPGSPPSNMTHIDPQDVGLVENHVAQPNQTDSNDPLLNMLMRLQEAANYNSQSLSDNNSDCASLDSNAVSNGSKSESAM